MEGPEGSVGGCGPEAVSGGGNPWVAWTRE